MRLETLLPLGKVDPGVRAPQRPLDLGAVAADAQRVEELGYTGLVVEETKDDPFVVLALAAAATSALQLAPAVAIAFPRSPTVMAHSGWTLQKLSRGRFTLGLGSQVRGHIQRRFGVPWSPPAPWMREYVAALRAIWDCWQNGTPLAIRGEHYQIDLTVPLFHPGPIDWPEIPIHLAALNPGMCRVAGEVADGVRPHPVCTPAYIEEVMLPAVRVGAARAGRPLHDFRVAMKPLVATAPTRAELAATIRDVRARVAFYASTPTYRGAFAHHGLEDLAARCQQLSRQQHWEALPGQIDDEVLERFAVVGTHDEIARKLLDRFGHVVTDIEFSIAAQTDGELEALAHMVREIQAGDTAPARRAIVGEPGAAPPRAL